MACEHGINASMLFKWSRHYRAGLLDSVPTPPLLLSVTIVDAPAPAASCATPPG
jgi:transposase-like protein